ncbi:membrane protein [sediment metagenome]|uniref:Membrane protein n=1 Tax=sediment metagenome TaxID=749907 RepID=D9PHG0_9ZZZZ
MQFDQNPFFRKVIIPWYDSKAASLLVAGFLILVSFFGILGISVAVEDAETFSAAWVPLMLVLTSMGVVVSILMRMINRRFRRSSL